MPDSAVREPRQARSRDTLARILNATEELLRESAFEDLQIARIVRRGRCSTGAFYERFSNKEALLPFLLERYYAELDDRVERFSSPERWEGVGLADRVSAVVRLMIDYTRGREGLMRALWLRNHRDPKTVPRSIRVCASKHVSRFCDLLLECDDEIAHPEPRLAVRTGFFVVGNAVQERILFPDAPNPATASLARRRLAGELTQLWLAYLKTSMDLRP